MINQNQRNRELIELAIKKIEEKAMLYNPKQNVYYLVEKEDEEEEDYINEIDTEDFCEDCIDEIVKTYPSKYPELFNIGKVIDREYYHAGTNEREGFRTCGHCCENFDFIWLYDHEDINHYIENELNLNNPMCCWELYEILNSYSYNEEYIEQYIKIVHKILETDSLYHLGFFENKSE